MALSSVWGTMSMTSSRSSSRHWRTVYVRIDSRTPASVRTHAWYYDVLASTCSARNLGRSNRGPCASPRGMTSLIHSSRG